MLRRKFVAVAGGLVASLPLVSHVLADDDPADDSSGYVGAAPDLDVLAEHQTIARYSGAPYSVCRGLTGACPENCGNSGEFATFAIVDYLHYDKPGQYGDDRQTSRRVQISDFHRRPLGADKLPSGLGEVIASLDENDLVYLAWNHLYGEISPGVTAPIRPILELRKVTEEEAEQLRAEAMEE